MKQVVFKTNSEEETLTLGEQLAKVTPDGMTLLLQGDLGAGKTTLVRGVARGLNITEVVQSPTFNIMKLYLGKKSLIHIDAYRLEDMDHNIGLDEYIGYENGYTFIEWPMFIKELIPENHVSIEIKNIDASTREFCIEGIEL